MRSFFAVLVIGLMMSVMPVNAGQIVYMDHDGNIVTPDPEPTYDNATDEHSPQVAGREDAAFERDDTNVEDASYGQFAPIGRPAVIGQSAPTGQSGPPCYNPGDPGCCSNGGGRCGRDLDGSNTTWDQLRRIHGGGYPREAGNGAHGTYLPGGAYVPYGGNAVAGAPVFQERGRHGARGVSDQRVAYGEPEIHTYTIPGKPHIVGYDKTCTLHHSLGNWTETLPGLCPHH